MKVCQYNALVRVWEDDQYRLDLRSALIRLDIRNAWCVGDHHPEPWQLEDVLPPRTGKAVGKAISSEWEQFLATRPDPTPAQRAAFQAFQVKCSIAMATKKWEWGTQQEVFPLPN